MQTTWRERLKKLAFVHDADPRYIEARRLARDWHTSPIGEYRQILEERGYAFAQDGHPQHSRLEKLAHQFVFTLDYDLDQAMDVLDLIQDFRTNIAEE